MGTHSCKLLLSAGWVCAFISTPSSLYGSCVDLSKLPMIKVSSAFRLLAPSTVFYSTLCRLLFILLKTIIAGVIQLVIKGTRSVDLSICWKRRSMQLLSFSMCLALEVTDQALKNCFWDLTRSGSKSRWGTAEERIQNTAALGQKDHREKPTWKRSENNHAV